MTPNWDNIKQEISKQEAPLSADAWNNLNAQLNAQKGSRKRYLWLLLLLPFLFGIAYYFNQHDDKDGLERELHKQELEGLNTNKALEKKEENQFIESGDADEDVKKANVENDLYLDSQKHEESEEAKITSKENVPSSISDKQTAQESSEKLTQQHADLERDNSTEEAEELRIAKVETQEEAILENDIQSEENIVFNGSDTIMEAPRSLSPEQTANAKWQLKFYAGPTYNSANVVYNDVEGSTHKDLGNSVSDGVQPGWGFDAGIEASYFITQHFKISTGLGYRKIETQNNYDYSVNNIPVIDSATGEILGYLPTATPQMVQSSASNQYAYFAIPLSLFYEVPLKGKWSLTGEFINTISFLLNQNSQLVNSKTLELNELENNSFNSTLFSYQVKLGLRYRLNPKVALAFEPAYRGQYNNTFSSDNVVWKPSDISLNIALILNLSSSKSK